MLLTTRVRSAVRLLWFGVVEWKTTNYFPRQINLSRYCTKPSRCESRKLRLLKKFFYSTVICMRVLSLVNAKFLMRSRAATRAFKPKKGTESHYWLIEFLSCHVKNRWFTIQNFKENLRPLADRTRARKLNVVAMCRLSHDDGLPRFEHSRHHHRC